MECINNTTRTKIPSSSTAKTEAWWNTSQQSQPSTYEPTRAWWDVCTLKRTNAIRRPRGCRGAANGKPAVKPAVQLLSNPKVFNDAASIRSVSTHCSSTSDAKVSAELRLERKYPALMSVLPPALREAMIDEEASRRRPAIYHPGTKTPIRYKGRVSATATINKQR